PIDSQYPEERIQYMLEDSKVDILLIQQSFFNDIKTKAEKLSLSEFKNVGEFRETKSDIETMVIPKTKRGSNDLAYVIYTSGSTGKPKGVMVEHRGVVRLVCNNNYIELKETQKILQTGSLSFDASTFEIWGALLNGMTLVLVNQEVITDSILLDNALAKHKITTMWLTSPLFNQLSQQNPLIFRNLKQLIIGGDVLSYSHVKMVQEHCPTLQIINGYGPTENTTFSCCFPIKNEIKRDTIPIGRPIGNTSVYIVNNQLDLQPINVLGELCVGGDGLARGYVNNEELTNEKFVENPFIHGEKMYRTGDLARWLPDGNIEYMGRMDRQVKIRGYRIELGEIENQLLKNSSINETMIISIEDQSKSKSICAYYTSSRNIEFTELREHMSKELPNYMIPSYFVRIEQFPLTPNGKIDHKKLPKPKQSHTKYRLSRNEIEEKLVYTWKEVLGVNKVGIDDHFFELGGDSIKAIQISARLNESGYKLELKQLFRYPRISELSKHIKPVNRIIKQDIVEGKALLTPIQEWFFDQRFTDQHHWNQAVMLFREQGFKEEIINKIFNEIIKHHDALRMVFKQNEEGKYEARNRDIHEEEYFSLDVFDIANEGIAQKDIGDFIRKKSSELQSTLDISNGPLMKLGLFRTRTGDHLLISIHHLVIDGVSWRILFDDVASAYEQCLRREEIVLPQKTDSFLTWSSRLKEFSNSNELLNESIYWSEIEGLEKEKLPEDIIDKKSAVSNKALLKENNQIAIELSEEETKRLLNKSNQAYNTEINDLLLVALGMTIHEWSDLKRIVVNLEGHGRENILEQIDVSRTIGWFTTQYPVVLTIKGEDLSSQIKSVKEELRGVPKKGIGYGILRYLSAKTNALNSGKRFFTPEISFNYLGQFDQDLPKNILGISPYSVGDSMSPNSHNVFKLNINGLVVNGVLRLTIDYSQNVYKRETVEYIGEQFKKYLINIIDHCVQKEHTERTPSDLQFKGLSLEELKLLEEEADNIL
ncbi:non-ribosomal peptide synthetase, partial [Bacillus subtilis]